MTWKQDILEIDSMVVSWWVVAFLCSAAFICVIPLLQGHCVLLIATHTVNSPKSSYECLVGLFLACSFWWFIFSFCVTVFMGSIIPAGLCSRYFAQHFYFLFLSCFFPFDQIFLCLYLNLFITFSSSRLKEVFIDSDIENFLHTQVVRYTQKHHCQSIKVVS